MSFGSIFWLRSSNVLKNIMFYWLGRLSLDFSRGMTRLKMSWLRVRLQATLPKRCWEETPDACATRLRQCCAYINSMHKVDGLCRESLPPDENITRKTSETHTNICLKSRGSAREQTREHKSRAPKPKRQDTLQETKQNQEHKRNIKKQQVPLRIQMLVDKKGGRLKE